MVIDTPLRSVDPRFASSNYDVKLSRLIAPGLTTTDTQDMRPALLLAESIDFESPTSVLVRVRQGIHFSSGQELSARDVVSTYRSLLSEDAGALDRDSYAKRIASIELIDSRQLRFRLHEPVATFLSDLDFGILQADSLASGEVIGTGAYKLQDFSEDGCTLVANPNYSGQGAAAKTRKLRVRVVRDDNARNMMLVGGSADFSQNSVRVDLVDIIKDRRRIAVESGKSAILTYLMMHNEDEILSDKRVRQAIALSIDREAIVAAKYGGRAELANSLLPSFHWAHNPDATAYFRDVPKAMKLLDAAGFLDPDGDGPKMRFELSYKTSANQFRVAVAKVIGEQLRQVGIGLQVQSFEFGTFFDDVKAGRYQLASMQTAAIAEPDFFYTYFHSERIPTPARKHLHNRWRFRNPRVDSLVEAGRREVRQERRKEIYAEVQTILAEELPIIPLWHEHNIVVRNRSVHGFQILPNGRFSSLARVAKD